MTCSISRAAFRTAVAILLAVAPAHAQDKSATSVIQLPSAGGTVTQEEGTFSLNSNTGSANFVLPLPELPQRGRHGPQIQLTYNQFAGDTGGGLGVGWRFTVPTLQVNNDLGTALPGLRPDGDLFSRISYMGSRLVYLGDDTGVARYRPEFAEEHVEIIRHDAPFEVAVLDRTGALVTETIPAGFEVLKADGSRQIFSADPAIAEGDFEGQETFVTRWALVLDVNASRDAIRYEYEKHGGRSYLTRVTFAGGQSTYEFDLIDTQPSLVSYAMATRQQNAKLYGKVTTRFGTTIYDQWCLGYIGRATDDNARFAVRAHPDCQAQAEADLAGSIDQNSVNVLDQLRILYRFGQSDGEPLGADTLRFPDISFDYSSWTTADLSDRDLVFEAPNLAFAGDIDAGNLELADLNMDALVDIVRTRSDGTDLLLGDGSFDTSFSEVQPLTLTRMTEAGMSLDVLPQLADNRFHFADILGDSYVDIVEIEIGAMHIYNGNAEGTFPYLGRRVPVPVLSPTDFADGRGRFADINLDGLSDIVTTRLNAEGKTEWRVFLNVTRRLPDGSHSVNFAVLNKPFPFEDNNSGVLGRPGTRFTDVNGDRLPDLVQIRPADQGFCIYENQGNAFTSEDVLLFGDRSLNDPLCGNGRFSAITGMSQDDNLRSMWYVDANGDGIIDFASMGQRTDRIRIWLGFGDGTYIDEPVELALNLRVQVGAAANTFRSRVADIDADGQTEIIVFQEAAGPDVRPAVVLDFNRTDDIQLTKANLLTVVEFDSGRRHDIRYATSTDEMLRDRSKGIETRSLHFPVVVAKQLVTSEGIPGQSRDAVQTEEYFYHKPYYDVLNRRFIGFSDVERVLYGDEFRGDEMTQRSSITFEQFYAFADRPADLHLAGKLKVRRIYEVEPDGVLVASASDSFGIDPDRTALHSLSTSTRTQSRPEPGRLLSCQSSVWRTVPTGDGANWLRRTSDRLTEAAGEDHVQPVTDESCINPVKELRFADFDDFNLHREETVILNEVAGPEGLVVPASTLVTQIDYEPARQDLAALGIVNQASERRSLSGTRVLSVEGFTYRPDRGGRMGERRIQVFSGLSDVPADLADLHLPTHTLLKIMDYDVFGNVTSMADALGTIEASGFDETGTLPLSHTRFAGAVPELDQVTRMLYDGPDEGRLARQVTPLGMEITYAYDALGRRTAERAEDGAEQLFDYQVGTGGLPSLIMTTKRRYATAADTPEDESEVIQTVAAFNARGNQIASIENVAEGGVRIFEFAAYNRNEKLIFRWTPFTIASFRGQADLDVAKVFALGDIPRPDHSVGNAYVYDGAGRMIREAHPGGKVSTQGYAPWGLSTITQYDDQFRGRMTVENLLLRNDNGTFANVLRNGAGRVDITRFERDVFGFLTAILLPGESQPRRFVFNTVGDLEHQSIPGMGEYFYFFDERGRQAAKVRRSADGETRRLTFEYDFLNRKVTEFENGERRIRFAYDRMPQLASASAFDTPIDLPLDEFTEIEITDANGLFDSVQRFGYDRNGRMIHNEITLGGRTYAENFDHTLDGRINVATGTGGLSSNFALGPDRNLRSVTIDHPDFATPEKVIEDLLYNAEGRIRRIDYRGGAFTDMTYNPDTLFLTHILSEAGGDVPLQDLRMVFNGNGSINEIVDSLAGTDPAFGHVDRSGTFEYDFKNQLVRINRYGEEDAFAYTPAGAFESNDEFAADTTLTPASADTGLIPGSTADQVYAFNGFGELAQSPRVLETRFDAYGRLLQSKTAEHEVFYGYDQTGRRIYKQIVPLDGTSDTETYFYPTETFHAGPKGDESFVNIGPSRLVRLEHGTGKWFYYLKDHLESSDYVMASDGTPVEQMLYRAYGTEHEPETLEPAWAQHRVDVADALPREKTHHRFTGKYLDDDTGLYYYGARYYDPALGRFISPDPLYMADPERCTAQPIACNLFAYANNNPMAFIDPTGLDGVVAGDEAYRRQVEEALQRIDPTARVDSETGEISQSWIHGAFLDIVDFFVPGSGYDTGRELVSRMVESEQTTTIQFRENDAAANRTDPTVDWTTTPGDADVFFDPNYSADLPEFDPETGAVNDVASDPGIVIGHELIHATHIMAGQVSGVDFVDYTGLDGTPQNTRDEEARTVGVGGTPRADDITENDLREMIGINPRNHY
ncbi:RHS repeat-associated core domain-containing protein [Thetidibacter halocola]|uniref:Insecticide toxin TcdB middle/N-terminal domain-containing protein n=1 Tax=Thetidibacter halocola TaxID=2827239 RepID=A0A8J8B919_9RHOB|nr:RHS repeat-associated core domain-containing protein [Thetidibacter halocola]MBS0125389.1 hypothetical protein [Thetidibacter halocola]